MSTRSGTITAYPAVGGRGTRAPTGGDPGSARGADLRRGGPPDPGVDQWIRGVAVLGDRRRGLGGRAAADPLSRGGGPRGDRPRPPPPLPPRRPPPPRT